MQKPQKYVVEQKNSRILLFPGQQAPPPRITQSKIISFIQAQSNVQNKLNIPFFMSLNALEPQVSPSVNLSYELMEILIQSYQMIITELGDSFEGLQLYFQNKINQLLRLPSALKILDEKKKAQKQENQQFNEEFYQMVDSVSKSNKSSLIDTSDLTQLSATQLTQLQEKIQIKQVEVVEEDEDDEKIVRSRPGRQNSLVSYLNMQQRLVEEEEKAKKILEEFDYSKKQIEAVRDNQLAEQSSQIENRLRKRNQKQLSGSNSQYKLAEIKEQDEQKTIDDKS